MRADDCFHLLRLRVAAAFFAARERSAFVRRRAADFAWSDKARCEAAERGSRLSAFFTARERVRDVFRLRALCPFFRSRFAWRRVLVELVPFFGGGNFTPARRAFERPIAIACLADRAPCLPSRMCSISSRTNSPAWVEGDFPSRSSSRARSIVSSSGIYQCSHPRAATDGISPCSGRSYADLL